MTIEATTVGPGVFTMGDPAALMTFSEQVTSCIFRPSVSQGDPIRVLSGGTAPGDRTETYALVATFLQDLGKEDSTTLWLWENRGKTVPFSYVPNSAAGVTISGKIEVEAVDMGGEASTKPTSEKEFVVTEPVVEKA